MQASRQPACIGCDQNARCNPPVKRHPLHTGRPGAWCGVFRQRQRRAPWKGQWLTPESVCWLCQQSHRKPSRPLKSPHHRGTHTTPADARPWTRPPHGHPHHALSCPSPQMPTFTKKVGSWDEFLGTCNARATAGSARLSVYYACTTMSSASERRSARMLRLAFQVTSTTAIMAMLRPSQYLKAYWLTGERMAGGGRGAAAQGGWGAGAGRPRVRAGAARRRDQGWPGVSAASGKQKREWVDRSSRPEQTYPWQTPSSRTARLAAGAAC